MSRQARSITLCAAVMLAVLAAPLAVHAQDAQLPAPMRTLLFFKVLTYVQNIANGRDMLHVGIVVRRGSKASEDAGRAVSEAVKKIRNLKVRGLAVAPDELVVSSAGEIEKAISHKKLAVLFLTPDVDPLLDQLCRYAASRKVIVGSGEPAHAKKCAAFAVVQREKRARILVNAAAAKSQGVAFDDALLRSAEQVR